VREACRQFRKHLKDKVICLQIPTPFEVGGTPGSEQFLPELIQAGGETSVSALHKHINSIWNKEELPDQWKKSTLYEFTKRVMKLTNNYHEISLLSTSYKILLNISLTRLSP
jgi:hypothetical protein